jgi:hypothetical protein
MTVATMLRLNASPAPASWDWRRRRRSIAGSSVVCGQNGPRDSLRAGLTRTCVDSPHAPRNAMTKWRPVGYCKCFPEQDQL